MAIVRTNSGVLGYIHALFRGGTVAGMADAQLLARFVARGDDEAAGRAFAALVERHGPMVLRVCRGVTRDEHLAEDAFQATFLVFARRARSLWVGDSLGPWLHAVAVRVASDARDADARRRRHERRCAEMAATHATADPDHGDVAPTLHEEIARLPRKYRAPVVLCDLEGMTHVEAAGQLGWPVGTLKTRLTGARNRLRTRLIRRGLAPTAALLASTLSAKDASSAVSDALADATVRAALVARLGAKTAAATAVTSATVEALTKGALRSMTLTKLKLGAASLAAALAVAGGTLACRNLAADGGQAQPAAAGNPGESPGRRNPSNATPRPLADKPEARNATAKRPPSTPRTFDLTVLDKKTGRPLAGVAIKSESDKATREGTTNGAGRFTVTMPEPGPGTVGVRIRRDGFVPTSIWLRRPGEAAAVSPAAYTLSLEPATAVGGRVQDVEGRPVAGATVYVLVPNRPAKEPGIQPQVDVWDEPNTTDAQGRWQCKVVPEDLPDVWLRLEHPDFVSDTHYGDTPRPPLADLRDGTAVMVMKTGLPVSGVVLDAQDRPVAGATVAQGGSRPGGHDPEVKTDAQGRFRFAQVAPKELVLTVQAKGHAPDLKTVKVVPGLPPVEFRLGPPRSLRGRVVDEGGKPIPGAWVTADGWRGYRSLSIQAVADADGRFQVDDLPDEFVEFQFSKDGYMNLPNRRFAPSQEAVVTLNRPLTISGTVTDAATGRPVERFTVYEVYDPNSGSTRWDRQRPQPFRGGRYEMSFRWPYPAVRGLRIEAEGYLPASSRGFKFSEGRQTYDFKLTPGTPPTRPAVSGSVISPDDTPATGRPPMAEATRTVSSQKSLREEATNRLTRGRSTRPLR